MPRLKAPPVAFAATTVQLRRRKPRMNARSPSSPKLSAATKWHVVTAADRYLRLSHTLPIGQAFRWADCGPCDHPPAFQGVAREWAGAIGDCLVILRQAETEPPDHMEDPVWYRLLVGAREAVVEDYLRLDYDGSAIMKACCANDDSFATVFPYLKGVRVLRTEPVECLFSFICSSNNNIKRITSMVRWLAERYGTQLGVHAGRTHYKFPTVEVLSREAAEAELREAGFGYRAKYIVGTAKQLHVEAQKVGMSAEDMLRNWRTLDRKDVAAKLTLFPGIGRKVASCIGLFSLDQFGEIPCDTHIWQIAIRHLPHLKQKSLTERVYDEVGDYFRGKFGEQTAGLAQTILFTGELPYFKKSLPGYAKPATRKRKKKEPSFVKEEKSAVDMEESFQGGARSVKEEVSVGYLSKGEDNENSSTDAARFAVEPESPKNTSSMYSKRANGHSTAEGQGMASKGEADVFAIKSFRQVPSGKIEDVPSGDQSTTNMSNDSSMKRRRVSKRT